MYEKAKNYTLTRPRLKKALGLCLVLVGFVALITPFTPGAVLFLFVGLEFLGLKFLFLERLFKKTPTPP